VTLTALCDRRLTNMPIVLFTIHVQEEPEWRQCLEAACNLASPEFNAGWAQMAKYTQYLFNLQHNTGRIIIEQRVCLNAYMEHATHTSHELERMGHENRILRQGMLGATDKDLKL
jgi:hypothetical protein